MTIKILLAPIYGSGYAISTVVLFHKITEGRKNPHGQTTFFEKPRPLTEGLIAFSASAVYSVFWPLYVPFVVTSMIDDFNAERKKD